MNQTGTMAARAGAAPVAFLARSSAAGPSLAAQGPFSVAPGAPSVAPGLPSATQKPSSAGPTPFAAVPERAVVELVARCDSELLVAQLATDPADRFLHAHLAALRLAGALLLAAGARPPRGRPRSAWDRLSAAVPAYATWSAFFTSGARMRAAFDAGVATVDDAFATTWVEAAEDFRDAVCLGLGIDPFADLRSALAWAS